MGGTIGSPPRPEDQDRPDPSLTAEEFRAQFTEDMREELCTALELLRQWRVREVMEFAQGKVSLEEAQTIVRRQMQVGMRALQLIAALAPQPYTTIGEGPSL